MTRPAHVKKRLERIELAVMGGGDPVLEESLRIIKNILVSRDRTKTIFCFRRQAKK